MKKFFTFAIFIFIIGLLACSSSSTTKNPSTLPSPGNLIKESEIVIETDRFPDAPDRDLFRLTRELVPGAGDLSWVPNTEAPKYLAGHKDTFWLMDLADTRAYQSDFELVLVTPHAYWYIEDGLKVDLSKLKRSASVFENDIYPVVTAIFGSEWNPGIDNDPHLNILNANLSGVAGYYSSTDEFPITVRPQSNQREMLYINAQSIPPGGADYDQVLAHELQHAIHWYSDASEETWINEGLAELSSSIALRSTSSIRHFLRGPPISLINWPISFEGGIANYGAASLFMHFLTEHYVSQGGLKALLEQPKDGIDGINEHLREMGYDSLFKDVFREWSVANILDGEGILGYSDLEVNAAVHGRINGFNKTHSEIPQYSVEYTELRPGPQPFTLSFQGSTSTALLPVDIGNTGCWWSNSGDSIDSTLAHRVKLPRSSAVTLDYEVWFEIEEDWDYVYVEVSVDGRRTWQIIETPLSSPENPIGNGFGPGYTGRSGGWVTESVDLSPYAGEDIWVRFQYVTDDAVNAAGACFRNLEIKAAGIDSLNSDWEAIGFVFTNNTVMQGFQVQIVTTGDNPQVQQVELYADNTAEITLQPPLYGQKLIVVVGSLAEKTREAASYTLIATGQN